MRPAGRNRQSHLTWLAVLGAATAVIALATSTTPASAHQGVAAKRLTCRGIISLSAIEKATELSMSYLGRIEKGSLNEWWATGPHQRGGVPGSGCLYNLHNPDGAFAQFQTEGTVEVGYGETLRN